jgi:pantoate--beta-alanine ligase
MERIESAPALQEALFSVRQEGRSIGFVPTLGALHEGHLTHVRALRGRTDYVVMSVFVNPLQFGPGEDFEHYPRDLARDAHLAEDAGVDLLFHPSVETMYPPGAETIVEVPELSRGLEGTIRPTHFRGVATVVTKLLNLVRPGVASFGQKDLQQLFVVRRVVTDLHLGVEILPIPTVREPDGLALSSRNAYLGAEDRRAATVLRRACLAGLDRLETGIREPAAVERAMAAVLRAEPRARMEYAVIRRCSDLKPLSTVTGQVALMVAAQLGPARLIDNLVVEVSSNRVQETLP